MVICGWLSAEARLVKSGRLLEEWHWVGFLQGQNFATHGQQGQVVGRENNSRKSKGKWSSVQSTLGRLWSLSLGCERGQQNMHRWTGGRAFLWAKSTLALSPLPILKIPAVSSSTWQPLDWKFLHCCWLWFTCSERVQLRVKCPGFRFCFHH